MSFLDGPFGQGLRPPLDENSSRYFRFFGALLKRSRVDGLMMMADPAIGRGLRKSDQKRSRARSRVVRLGCSLSRSAVDDQLLLYKQVFRDDCPTATGSQ